MKGRECFAVEARVNVARERLGFTQSKLSGGRTRVSILRIGDGGAIAHRPETALTVHTERAVYDHGSAFVLLDREGLEQRVWRRASSPYYGLGAHLFRRTQDHCSGPRVDQTCIKLESHAAFSHSRLRIAGERLAQLGQNAIARMDEDSAQFLCLEVRIIGQHAAGKVIQRASQLHAGKATASDHEG